VFGDQSNQPITTDDGQNLPDRHLTASSFICPPVGGDAHCFPPVGRFLKLPLSGGLIIPSLIVRQSRDCLPDIASVVHA
jgi:hypothetical protein